MALPDLGGGESDKMKDWIHQQGDAKRVTAGPGERMTQDAARDESKGKSETTACVQPEK
jgi:hypothetical protein